MKTTGTGTRKVLLVASLLLGVPPAPLRAGLAPGSGIAGTAHDFTTGKRAPSRSARNTSTCVFCHADIQRSSSRTPTTRPAWQSNAGTAGFSWSDATHTTGGTPLPTNLATWPGPTKNCLSCHDGTIATSGLYEPSKDLKGNHPVGVPYPYNGAPSTYNGITTGRDVDLSGYVPVPANVKLFTRPGADVLPGTQLGATGIECPSCHDVHNQKTLDRGLLRNTRRQLCLDCHQ